VLKSVRILTECTKDKSGGDTGTAEDIVKKWMEDPIAFAALDNQEKYLAKRAISKEFTEVVLSTKRGRLINKALIWDTACFGAELVRAITGNRFKLVAVGSYSIVCQYYT
jgi:hypothetical protein